MRLLLKDYLKFERQMLNQEKVLDKVGDTWLLKGSLGSYFQIQTTSGLIVPSFFTLMCQNQFGF